MDPDKAVSMQTNINGLALGPATAADAAAICSVVAASHEHLTQHDDYHDLVAASEADIAAEITVDTQQPFVMCHDGTIVGTIYRMLYQSTVFGLGYWIGAAFASRGFTRAAVETVIQHAIANPGATEIWAGIKHANTPSIRLMTRLGFKLAREQNTHLSYCLTVQAD